MFKKISLLSEKTHRSKSFYIKQLLEKHLDELEESYLALEILNNKNTKYYTTKEMEKMLDL
jgi:RHH-type rel operon transcriptional repressor/antitoxin RelB